MSLTISITPGPLFRQLATTESRSRFLRRALLFTCLFLALAGRLCFWSAPLDGDGYMFAYMGKLISQGGRFQQDLIDNKFPTVGLLMTVPWRLFGANGSAYLLLQLAMGLSASVLLARAAGRHFGSPARCPTLLAALLLNNFSFIVGGGFQLETVQIFFATLAASAALEALASASFADAFTAGLAGGMAAMVKPTGAAVLAAFAVAMMVRFARDRRQLARLFVGLVCGFAIPAVGVLIYLIGSHTLQDIPTIYHQISVYAANSLWEPFDLIKPMSAVVVLGFPLLVRGWIFRRKPDRLAVRIDRSMLWFVIIWLALEFAGVVLQRRMYAYHFLVLAPPAALLFGILPRRDRTLTTAAALAPVMFLCGWSSIHAIQSAARQAPEPDIAAYLRTRTLPGDYVWRDRVMAVLLQTDLRSGSRLPMSYLFMNSDDAPLYFSNILLTDFAARRPIYIVLPADLPGYINQYSHQLRELTGFPRRQANFIAAWTTLGRYVQSHYTVETRLGGEAVYRRIDR